MQDEEPIISQCVGNVQVIATATAASLQQRSKWKMLQRLKKKHG